MLEFVKFSTMTPLQEQVTALDICSKCHEKTLVLRHVDTSGGWLQCSKCLTVYHTADRATSNGEASQ